MIILLKVFYLYWSVPILDGVFHTDAGWLTSQWEIHLRLAGNAVSWKASYSDVSRFYIKCTAVDNNVSFNSSKLSHCQSMSAYCKVDEVHIKIWIILFPNSFTRCLLSYYSLTVLTRKLKFLFLVTKSRSLDLLIHDCSKNQSEKVRVSPIFIFSVRRRPVTLSRTTHCRSRTWRHNSWMR